MRAGPLLALVLAGCAAPARDAEAPGVAVEFLRQEGRWGVFAATNRSDRTWGYWGHGPEGLLALTCVEHLEDGAWETCLTALGSDTGAERFELAPGARIELRALFDEARPTRLGLPIHADDRGLTAWSPAVDPRPSR